MKKWRKDWKLENYEGWVLNKENLIVSYWTDEGGEAEYHGYLEMSGDKK